MNDRVVITEMDVSVYTVPTSSPEADGTLEWSSTTMVLIHLSGGGKRGIGYTYAHPAAAQVAMSLKVLVVGTDVLALATITERLTRHIRNDGTCGIAMMAVSAIDNALWDLKAKVLDLPLAVLLGRQNEKVLIYGSGGFVNYSEREMKEQFSSWLEQGIRYIKMKIGAMPKDDDERMQMARKIIGNETELFVDANGAYQRQAALAKAYSYQQYGITWFEEPVPSYDLDGLRYLRYRAPATIAIAAGEYGYDLPYFKYMLDAGAVTVLQADATRCGGISGFIRAGNLCEAYHLPFSAHCAPSMHAHAALALPSFYIAEYFYDHARLEQMFFDGCLLPVNGVLTPDLSRPGHGLDLKAMDAERYRIA